MKKLLVALISLSFLMGISFSYNACEPEFGLDVRIRVVDYSFRPVEGVSVTLTYQKSKTIHEINGTAEYATTKPFYTDAKGVVVIPVKNRERVPENLDCIIKINVSRFNYFEEFELDLRNMTNEVLVKVPFYKLTLNALKNEKPVFARYAIGNETFEGSKVVVWVPEGYVEGIGFYQGVKRFFNITINNDTDYSLSFDAIQASLNFLDSFGNPLNVELSIEGKVYSGYGKVDFPLPYYGYTTTAVINGVEKKITIYDNEGDFFLDLEPPRVNNIDISYDGSLFITTFQAFDPGEYASGIGYVDVKVKARSYILGTLAEVGTNSYMFKAPLSNYYGNITITIIAKDNEGNTKNVDVVYEVSKKEQTVEQVVEESEEDGIGKILFYISVVVIIVVAVWLGWKIKTLLED